MRPPAWAADLVAVVCADAGAPQPDVAWRQRRGPMSTGVARRRAGTISIRAGDDPLDQRLTLLHELAHWLSPSTGRGRRVRHHGREFYRVAFALYDRHGVPASDALRLESARYPSSLGHAVALGVAGANGALSAHRARLRERPARRWRVLVPEHSVRLGRNGRWHVCLTCHQRIVGRNLARARRGRPPLRHLLMVAEPG